MTVLQPPSVPIFVAGTQGPQMAAALNALVRDPLTFLVAPPTARLRRTGAFNLRAGQHQYIPMDTADEDSASGWTAPAAVGGGGSTTLNGATIAGATTATLTSATGFVNGQIVRIESSGANVEYRQITISGSVITVPTLQLAHANGATVVQVTSDPSQYVIRAPGWYEITGTTSLSGTGAAGLEMSPGIGVNGNSQTGIGATAWEGTVPYPPTGVSTQPKTASSRWEVYCNLGDVVQLDLWYSTESAITAVDTTAGLECSMRLVWAGL